MAMSSPVSKELSVFLQFWLLKESRSSLHWFYMIPGFLIPSPLCANPSIYPFVSFSFSLLLLTYTFLNTFCESDSQWYSLSKTDHLLIVMGLTNLIGSWDIHQIIPKSVISKSIECHGGKERTQWEIFVGEHFIQKEAAEGYIQERAAELRWEWWGTITQASPLT